MDERLNCFLADTEYYIKAYTGNARQETIAFWVNQMKKSFLELSQNERDLFLEALRETGDTS